jgi:ABC-2 type transport system permease protein
MILTVVRISLLRLWHNRGELMLTFVVPLVFFSIFAWIFGSRDGSGSTPKIKIALADVADTIQSRQVIEELRKIDSLRVMKDFNAQVTNTQSRARIGNEAADWVRRGQVTAAIVLKPSSAADSKSTKQPNFQAELLSDSYDQVASQILRAVVEQTVIAVQQRHAMPSQPSAAVQTASAITPIDATSTKLDLPQVLVRDVMGENKTNPVIAMYAAGIAVMFALFSTATSSGSLLEERENSTLERLLCSKLSVDQLLMGKWLYLCGLGFIQISLMFTWGWLVFGVDLPSNVDGFLVMTIATSAAAASFALMIATACKTRVQLGWLSTIVILIMSALGGSMVPRYLMSESVQQIGMLTFNAWALEGYNKVFWRDLNLASLHRELAVLVGSAFAMLIAARVLITRWERA